MIAATEWPGPDRPFCSGLAPHVGFLWASGKQCGVSRRFSAMLQPSPGRSWLLKPRRLNYIVLVAFGRQVYAATAQALAALSNDAAQTLLYKHLGGGNGGGMMGAVEAMTGSADEAVGALIAELVVQQNQLRHSAPTRHVFDSRVNDLQRWLFHDGLSVDHEGHLVTVGAAVEEATGIRDQILEELTASGLDADHALERALNEAVQAFRSNPPDFNESTTKVRIALETVARRAAPAIAGRRGIPAPADTWGSSLTFLRISAQLITLQEEQTLAAVYTLISPGAHRPTGLTDEEWARLARTFALSATYFLLRKYRTAP